MNNRVLYSDNGSLKDFSVALNNYYSLSSVCNYVAGEDYLYVGARLPFNHIYLKLRNSNTADTQMKIELWNGDKWVEVVEIIDETDGFKQSGMIQWTPNRNESWDMECTNDNGEMVEGLESVVVYDRYWIRISFTNDFESDEDVELSWMGNLFSFDFDLGSEYPDLVRAEVLDAYKSGKTTWEEQHVKAGQILIQDLVDKGVVKEKGQILDWREFTNASLHKVAEIIFNAMGDDYIDQGKAARQEYISRMSKKTFRVDLNNNAIEEPKESFSECGFMTR